MSMKFYNVTLRTNGADRVIRVPSPTGVQATDAAVPLMREGEQIIGIEEVEDDGLQRADGFPPKTQAEELAPVTPGMAATDISSATSVAPEARTVAPEGQGGQHDELLDAGQEEVFSRTEVESGRIEHNAAVGGSDQ